MSPNAPEWTSGWRPDTSGTAAFTIMVRDPNDPERKPRPKKGGRSDKTPHHTLAKVDLESFKAQILAHLSDGQMRTLNHIGVELWGKTADITGGTKVEEALWQLAEASEIQFTTRIPIYWRKRPSRPPKNDQRLLEVVHLRVKVSGIRRRAVHKPLSHSVRGVLEKLVLELQVLEARS